MTTLSLACVLAESARRYPGKVAVVDGDVRVTYADLWAQARSYGAALAELGIGPGDAVAMVVPNVLDFPRAYYGTLAAGAVVVPVHLLLTPDEAAYIVRDSRARLVVCHSSQLGLGVAAARAAGVPLVTVGPLPEGTGHRRLEDVAAGLDPLSSYRSRSAEDAAVIFYTSGTTGQPKGAILTHLNLVLNATVNVFDTNDARHTDVVLGCLPLFHTFGQSVGMNGAFRLGATLVLLPRCTGADEIDTMLREGVDVFHGVPTMYIALLEAAPGYDRLPSLRLCVSGGASLPVAVLERFNTAFRTTIFEGYGLSETSPTATTNQPHFGTRAGTVGHPIWGVEVEIARAEVDERVEFLPAGELGEIVIRGHNVFAGYLGRPEDTALALVDGWFRSGDLGTKDEQGFISIVDRKKDIVIRGGFNVYPREIEDALASHPDIAEVAVVGVSHPYTGEAVKAFVVPRPGAVFGADQLNAHVATRLARFKWPTILQVVDQLPHSATGKVAKGRLRESST
jgi:long-chain acyl-CoA synthetase